MIVIADDITGAAEIAGIAFAHGEDVRLVIGSATATGTTTVIATDTRSMTEKEAVAETQRLMLPLLLEKDGERLLFKKTDSALRGHVVTELLTLMEVTGYRRTVFLPANPSKGRIIRDGVYYIKESKGQGAEVNDVPINQTVFSFDPEFPAKTAILKERFPNAEQKGIIMPDAESKEDIRKVIADYDDGKTLFAGAADLFEVFLEVKGLRGGARTAEPSDTLCKVEGRRSIILCGSTQSKPLNIGIPVTAMPRIIYDGSKDIASWVEEAAMLYGVRGSLIITIPYHHRTGRVVAMHLREMTALLIGQLVERRVPEQLIIEGGASAFATLERLGWYELEMVCQLAPGIIKTKAPNGTFVILKPGSYPWGSFF